MHHKPNAIQKLIHRFLMLRPVSAFMARALRHADTFALRLSRGRWTFASLVGLPIIQLTTTGAKSGLPRTVPLVGLIDGEKIALIGSNFGQACHPGWVYNLKSNPECQVSYNGMTQTYRARFTKGQERETYWQLALSYYAGYEKYRSRAGEREIAVILLEPKR
jgi:deazaflavin-dependent oxidoreductase (nitroreductase family)